MQEVDNTPTSQLLTSEELRLKVISKSQQRGKWVAMRRIARRWVAWMLWRWILPMVGLVTVLMVVATLSLVYHFGSETAIDSTQTWLFDQFGIAAKTTPAVKQELKSHEVAPAVLSEPAAGIASAQSEPKLSAAIHLQLERSIAIHHLIQLPPDLASTSTNNKTEQHLPKENQP